MSERVAIPAVAGLWREQRVAIPAVAILWREHNMGDHSERLPEVVEVLDGETVQQIANRLLNLTGTYRFTNFTDALTIQLARPAEEGGDPR